jgi:hypothetical protein
MAATPERQRRAGYARFASISIMIDPHEPAVLLLDYREIIAEPLKYGGIIPSQLSEMVKYTT